MNSLKLLSIWMCVFFAAFCQPVRCTYALGSADSLKVVAVQYRLDDHSYESEGNFEKSIDGLLTKAAKYAPDLVVFPEYIGIFIAATGLPYQDYDIYYGMEKGSTPDDYAKKIRNGILLSQCRQMNKIYVDTFSKMARKHKIFIAAGTIPECDYSSKSNFYNVCFVFNPEGKIILRQPKIHLVSLEGPAGLNLSCGKTNEWKTFSIKGHRIGVLICLDAFKPDAISQTMRHNAEIVINPVANPEKYSPMMEQSFKSGLWTMVQNSTSVKYGVMSCLVGTSYSCFFEGQSAIIAKTNLTADRTGYIQKACFPSDEELLFAELKMPGFSALTWNIGCADLKASPASDRYLPRISAVINELDPDVVALQEQATQEQFDKLLGLLKGRYNGKTTATATVRGVSILSKLPIAKWEVIHTRMGWKLLAAEVETACLKKKCYFVSCYAPAGKSALNRNMLCADLTEWAKSKQAPTFLAGDFNFAPDNWLDRHVPFFSDNVELDEKTYNHIVGFADDLGAKAGATALLNRRVDYIFAFPKELAVEEIQVIKNKRTGAMDHNPVFMRVDEDILDCQIRGDHRIELKGESGL